MALSHRSGGAALEAASVLANRAAELAPATEAARRLSPDLSSAIADAGLYRLCVPRSAGGGEVSPAELLATVEVLATGDAAVGWCVAVCATSGMLAAYLDRDTAVEVYGDRAGVVGGVFAPSGRATASGDRFEVTGRWRFASNVANCDWLMAGCVVMDGEQPRLTPRGRPDVRLVLVRSAEVEVLDTWRVSGLRGTGSHDFAIDAASVDGARSASLVTERPREGGPLYAFPPFGLLAAAIAAVALGTARGALDDLIEIAGTKTPTLSARKLAERPATQARLAAAEARLRGARSHLEDAVGRAWDTARAGGEMSVELRAGIRMAATAGVEAAAASVDDAYALAGGSAIYETSPLERRFRDVHAATQHMLVAPATWELTGRALLGLELDDSQL